jgi:hypothetical protein
MAKQAGPFYITGCYGNLCFYCMDGKYYARLKSSLDRKRVKRDPAFHKTMRNAELFGKASKIASYIYRALPKKEKEHALYRKLTGRAMLLLKDGKKEEEVMILLNEAYIKKDTVSSCKVVTATQNYFADEILYRVFSSLPNYREVEALYEYEDLPP